APSDSARSACVPAGVCSILRTGPLRAAAQGSRSENGRVEGSASVARVDVSGIVTADLVWSRCASRDGGLSGASAITNVTVGGQLLGSDPRPNTVIELPGVARVILNEQIKAPDSITVNAIHVHLLSGTEGDVILPQAHCAVTRSLVPAMPESPLVVLVPALTMAALMSVVVLAW